MKADDKRTITRTSNGLKILVSGRVQGVCYRAFVRARATEEHVTGSAINLPDGRVEVTLYGSPEAVERVRKAAAQGPPGARVDGIENEASSEPAPEGFLIG